jgi:hypothetical protein
MRDRDRDRWEEGKVGVLVCERERDVKPECSSECSCSRVPTTRSLQGLISHSLGHDL